MFVSSSWHLKKKFNEHKNSILNDSCTLEGMSGAEVICQYMHNGQGLDYLILAGTYFILVFTVSGILMGYLADKVHRPHLLSACVALFRYAHGIKIN